MSTQTPQTLITLGRVIAERDHYKALCEELRLALERTAYALELAFTKKPLRDMAETLAEASAALKKAEKP
jgi:hypothetical protein